MSLSTDYEVRSGHTELFQLLEKFQMCLSCYVASCAELNYYRIRLRVIEGVLASVLDVLVSQVSAQVRFPDCVYYHGMP